MRTHVIPYTLHFKVPSGTSRGILTSKPSWFIVSEQEGRLAGIGECSIIEGLSPEDPAVVEDVLISAIHDNIPPSPKYPAARFAYEMWRESIASTDPINLYPSDWSKGQGRLPINGLIWMGSASDMKAQIATKIEAGFDCIKMKIGAIDFDDELHVLSEIRQSYSPDDITLRVDANGAFSVEDALEKLKRLSDLDLHSIEQPVKQGQWEEMARLCEESPLDIALDEELIGITRLSDQERLLEAIRPAYIILKPSLLGGIGASKRWIDMAEDLNIGWWVTSALESNIGLNAITRWTAGLHVSLPQGLGTGGLFTNNIEGSLAILEGNIVNDPSTPWDFSNLTI